MRVSSITPNVSFKRVTKVAAKHALNETKKGNSHLQSQDVKRLIAKGYTAISYDVGYDSKSKEYTVYRNNEKPRGITMIIDSEKRFKDFEEAVNFSSQKQKQQDEFFPLIAKSMDEANVLGFFAIEDTQK